MRKIWLFFISLLAGMALFLWVGKIIGWAEIKKSFLVFTGWQGMLIFFLTFLLLVLRNWTWQEILREKEVKISFFKLFKIYLSAFSLRVLAPIFTFSDEILQTITLKEKNSVPISKGAASVILERVLEVTVNFLFIIFGILYFVFKATFPPKNLAIILGGTFLFLLVTISFFYFKVLKKESLAKSFLKIFNQKIDNQPLEIEKEIFDFFKFKKISTWKIVGLSFLRAIITYLRNWLSILFLVGKVDFFVALSILSFSFLISLIPIPAALGSQEAVQIFIFNSFELNPSLVPAFAMVIRASELIFAIFGLLILFKLGIDLLKKVEIYCK
jgi:uncharacterized protein (TIRG00374 family)